MTFLLQYKTFFPAVILFVLMSVPDASGQSGTIYWRDGHTSRVDTFSEVSIELVYHWWYRHRSTDNQGEYQRIFNLPDLKKITFVRQRGRWSTGFYYRVRISGLDNNGEWFEEEIPTWDWLDMTIPTERLHKKTTVTFFHQKRKISIQKIEFE